MPIDTIEPNGRNKGITERMVREVWSISKRRHKPFALKYDGGRLYVIEVGAVDAIKGDLIGVYSLPTLEDLREDLLEVSRG